MTTIIIYWILCAAGGIVWGQIFANFNIYGWEYAMLFGGVEQRDSSPGS